MSKSPKNHDPEKLLELFKKSKKVVSTFVDQFQIKNGRKPHGEDLASAPEYVRVCIKNCKRIKAHLEKSPEAVTEQEPKKPSSPKTKHIPVQKTKTSLMENLENSMSQPAPAKANITPVIVASLHSSQTCPAGFFYPQVFRTWG